MGRNARGTKVVSVVSLCLRTLVLGFGGPLGFLAVDGFELNVAVGLEC